MADLAGRLRLLERKVQFVMDNLRMKAGIASGLVDAAGVPQVKVFDGSLAELFALSQELPMATEDDVPTLKAALEAATGSGVADG